MKVVHVSALDVSLSILVRAQLRALQGAGFEVHTASSPGPGLETLRGDGIVCHEVPIARSASVRPLGEATRRLHALFRRERFDVVHTHTPVASVAARAAARFAGVPHVFYTAHGFYFHDAMRPTLRAAHVNLERALGRWTEHLFCQSDEDRLTAIRERIMPGERVTTLGNGVDIARFQGDAVGGEAARRQARERYGIPPDSVVVGFMGRLVAEKGIFELLEAMGTVLTAAPNSVLVIIGARLDSDRETEREKRLDALMGSLAGSGRVITTGLVSVSEIPGLINALDVFTLPSHREGMPRSILEAMASGKPVVATDIRGCREEVVPEETGLLVPVRSPEALASALLRLVKDRELREAWGEAGRRRAEALFDERAVCDRILARYDRLNEGSQAVVRANGCAPGESAS